MEPVITQVDAMGRQIAVISRSDSSHAVLLSAGQARTVSVPSGARAVLFSATGDFWTRFNGAAAVPTANILDGTACELNPVGRDVTGVSVIGVAAAAACTINLVFYR